MDSGDIAMMMIATAFVMLQTPAAGFAQAGLIRRKNALSMLMQSLLGMALGSVLWVTVGFSLTFGPSLGGWIGTLENAMFLGVSISCPLPNAPSIPGVLFGTFQMMFALMVPVLVTGAWAERMNFRAFLVFVSVWPFLVYYPLAHWIWNTHGWMALDGVKDFAGGITIHASAGAAGLAVSWVLAGRMKNRGQNGHHNIPLSVIGGSIIWAGWYFFNGGSANGANEVAVRALFNTHMSACTGAITWTLLAFRRDGFWHVTDLINGALAGLGGITAASGFVRLQFSLLISFCASFGSYVWVYFIKPKLGLDDALDVTGLQGVPGTIGSMMLGFLDPVSGGWLQFGKQTYAVAIGLVWSAFWSVVLMYFIKITVGIDVSPEEEELGLDFIQIGEQAYDDRLDDKLDLGEQALAAKLIDACTKGNFSRVRKLVHSGADVHLVDYDGRSALHLASAEGHLDLVRYLVVQQGVDVNVLDRFQQTPLADAVRGNHSAVVEFLESHGAVVKQTSGAQIDTELICASSMGDLAACRLRLKSGAHVNAADYDGRTALHVAASEGHDKVVKFLLESGANEDVVDRWGRTALDDALHGHHNKCIRLFKRGKGIAPSPGNSFHHPEEKEVTVGLNSDANTPLLPVSPRSQEDSFVSHALLDAASNGDLTEIKVLAQKGASLNICDYDSRTLLHLAASSGHIEIVKFLLQDGNVNVNVFDRFKKTPLQDAVSYGHYEICKLLRDKGATVMDPIVSRELCFAAATGDVETLARAEALGMDLNTGADQSSFFLTCIGDNDGRTALHLACSEGQAEVVKYLVKSLVRLNARDRWGNTPLADARREGHGDVVEILIQAGATL